MAAKNQTPKPMPDLELLYQRHYGVTQAVAAGYAEAAAVSFSRHHSTPTNVRVRHKTKRTDLSVPWTAPTAKTMAAWANNDDATRDGAYSVALATTESELGLVAIHRAETKSGADYYLGQTAKTGEIPDLGALETAPRLEVSGTDQGSEATARLRLKQKIKQTQNARKGPAVACVVAFQERLVLIKQTDGGDA